VFRPFFSKYLTTKLIYHYSFIFAQVSGDITSQPWKHLTTKYNSNFCDCNL